jgi:hypothetical protein
LLSLFFRTCRKKDSRKPGGIRIEWDKFLAHDDDSLGEDINTIKNNMEVLLDASKEVGLEVNTEKTKHMIVFHHQTAEQNHNIKAANKFLESVARFMYLGMTVTNQNCIQEEIKSSLNLGMDGRIILKWILRK